MEHAVIKELDQRLAELDGQIRDAKIRTDDLTREQDRIEGDAESVRARRTRDQDRMDRGLVGSPKDLERLQQEMESLERRITSLEDQELEIMEQLEQAQSTLDTLVTDAADASGRRDQAIDSRDRHLAELEAQLADLAQRREPLVDGLPTDLLTLYERLRASKGGVGASALRARRCGGCQLTLDNAELHQLRAMPADQVARCEECQRILVRTDESGL